MQRYITRQAALGGFHTEKLLAHAHQDTLHEEVVACHGDRRITRGYMGMSISEETNKDVSMDVNMGLGQFQNSVKLY